MYSNIVATGAFAWAPSSGVPASSGVDPGTSNADIVDDGLEEGSGDSEEDEGIFERQKERKKMTFAALFTFTVDPFFFAAMSYCDLVRSEKATPFAVTVCVFFIVVVSYCDLVRSEKATLFAVTVCVFFVVVVRMVYKYEL
ncbi:hypothetical protein POTOM_043091 [Populus tomentosa]|uniref:Uncharacterized protein n=1 Tax=Populus tomentosa TaxID=118781 RepID=A0A8X7YPZ3_POPTO|nr:hypothetical protein POTOM_043091 [Populus tomentosa]